MHSLPWAGLASSATTVFIPAHGDPVLVDGTNAFVFWALPVAKLVFNVSGAGATGALLLASVALKAGKPEHARALNFAGISAVIWMLSAAVAGFMDYLDNWREPVALTASFGHRLLFFFANVGLGQMWLLTVVLISVIPLLCFGTRSLGATVLAALLALASWVPLGTIGHPNYGEGHEAGILAFILHIIAAAAWVGGLITLIILRPCLDRTRMRVVAGRYSTLALIAFIVLVFSGLLKAHATVATVENLRSPFGAAVAVKIGAVMLLGLVGFVHRRQILHRMERDIPERSVRFWGLVVLELLVMGLASGAAVTLLRLDGAIPDDPVVDYRVLAEKMADQPLPPAPAAITFLTETLFDPLWTVLVAAGTLCYLAGVRRVRREGGNWPAGRTAGWLAGMATLFYLTNGGVNQYQNFLLSAQILLQMALTTVVALLLVLGRPVTLAMFAVRPRQDGSMGVREWITTVARGRMSRVFMHPYVAAGFLMASTLAYYYSSLLEWSARELPGHQWMMMHFLAVGSLLGTAVFAGAGGGAQAQRRVGTTLVALAAFYTLLGATMIFSTHMLSPDWYAAMNRPRGIDPAADQGLAGKYIVVLGIGQVAGLTAEIARRHWRCDEPSPPRQRRSVQGRRHLRWVQRS